MDGLFRRRDKAGDSELKPVEVRIDEASLEA